METCYQTEGFRQYMVLKGESKDVDDFQLNMLMRYEGSGLLPLEIQGCDGQFQIAYDTKGTQTLSQMSEEQELDFPVLRQLFTDLWNCYKEMEEYLLPLEGILTAPEMIYYHAGKRRFRFCFRMGGQGEFHAFLIMLVEFCMKHTRHQDTEAVMYIYGLYRLLQEETAGIEEVQCFLENMEKQMKKEPDDIGLVMNAKRSNEPEREEIGKTEGPDATQRAERTEEISRETDGKKVWIYRILTGFSLIAVVIYALRYWVFLGYDRDCKFMIFSMILFLFFLYSTIKLRRRQNRHKVQQRAEESGEERREKEKTGEGLHRSVVELVEPLSGETGVIGRIYDGETGLIQVTGQDAWQLKGAGTQDILLKALPGIIGRSNLAEYPLEETGISRKHARVFQQDGELYIEDLASTNGTYCNGRRISRGKPVRLEEGTRLVLGANHYIVEKVKKHCGSNV